MSKDRLEAPDFKTEAQEIDSSVQANQVHGGVDQRTINNDNSLKPLTLLILVMPILALVILNFYQPPWLKQQHETANNTRQVPIRFEDTAADRSEPDQRVDQDNQEKPSTVSIQDETEPDTKVLVSDELISDSEPAAEEHSNSTAKQAKTTPSEIEANKRPSPLQEEYAAHPDKSTIAVVVFGGGKAAQLSRDLSYQFQKQGFVALADPFQSWYVRELRGLFNGSYPNTDLQGILDEVILGQLEVNNSTNQNGLSIVRYNFQVARYDAALQIKQRFTAYGQGLSASLAIAEEQGLKNLIENLQTNLNNP